MLVIHDLRKVLGKAKLEMAEQVVAYGSRAKLTLRQRYALLNLWVV